MKLWLLGKLDDAVHFLVRPFPLPLWAYRVCQAYEREFDRQEPRNAHADNCAIWTQSTGDCTCGGQR